MASVARKKVPWTRTQKALVVTACLLMVVGAAISVVELLPQHQNPSPLIAVETIGENSGYTAKACSGVTSCSQAIAVVANSVLLIGSSEYGTATLTYAVHGYTPTSLEAPSTSSTYPTEAIEGVLITSAATVTVYVNYTSSEYYVIDVADFTNTVVTATYTSGTGSTTGDSTAGTCTATMGTTNEVIFSVYGAKTTAESTMTPGQGTQLTGPTATTSSVVTAEDQYYADSSSGSYETTNTLASTADWRSACVGLEPASVPTAPTGLTAGTVTATTIPLTWTVTAAQSAYLTAGEVYWATYSGSCGAFSSSAAASSPYTSYTVTGLVSGNAYCFEVTVSNGTGASADSSILSDVATLTAPSAPTSPAAFAEPQTTTQAVITWTLGSGTSTNQTIVRYANSGCTGSGTFTNIADATAQTFTATGLSAGTTYGWEVQGWNSVGEGAWSSCASTTTYVVPSAPTGLGSTAITTTSVSLAWTNPTPSAGSLVNDTVYMGTSCGTWTTISSTNGVAATFATGPNLNPYTTYCFAVGAWTGGGQTSLSSTLSVTTLAGSPGAATGLSGSSTSSSVTVTWTNPTPASGSVVNDTFRYATNTGSCGTWTIISAGVVGTYTVNSLAAATTYCAAVQVWTQGGGSPWAFTNVTTQNAASGAPTGLTLVSSSRTTLTLSWTNPTGSLLNDTVYYRQAASCTGALTGLSVSVTTTYTISGLVAGDQYSIQVTAWTSGGQSSPSTCLSVYTYGATPPAPYSLTPYSATATTLSIGWVNPTGYTLFNDSVYVSTAGGSCGTWSQKDSTGGVTTGYTITGLSPGSTYCIQVTAWDQQSNLSAPLVDHTQPGDPYVVFTVWNNQSVGTGTYNQIVHFDSNNYAPYLNANDSNVRFTYNANGTAVPAWLQNNDSSTSTNTTYWLLLYNIPSDSYVKVRAVIDPTGTFDWSRSGPTGAWPNATATYGQFDDGYKVFAYYTNFSGTSLPSGWSAAGGGGSQTVHSGLIDVSTGASHQTAWSGTVTNPEAFFAAWKVIYFGSGQTYGVASLANARSVGDGATDIACALPGGSYGGAIPDPRGYQVFSLEQSTAAGTSSCTLNFTTFYSQTHADASDQWEFYLGTYSATFTNYFVVWTDTPNDIMPQVSFSGLNQTPPAPTDLAGTSNGYSAIDWTWTQSTGGGILNDTLILFSGGLCTGVPVSFTSTGGAATGTRTGSLTANTTYSAEVTSWNLTGQSPASVCESATTHTTTYGGGGAIEATTSVLVLVAGGILVVSLLTVTFTLAGRRVEGRRKDR